MPGVDRPLAQVWLDRPAKVLRVPDRPCQHEATSRAPRRLDREVRPLFGSDPARPHQIVAAGTEGPALDVDTVGHHDHGVDDATPGSGGVAADRGEGDSGPPAGPIADSSQENGGVCNVLSIGVPRQGAMTIGTW